MRKMFIVAVAVTLSLMLVGSVFAAEKHGAYGAAGCGLGSLVFQDQPGMVQVLAATTNGTFGSQTFGITSGTSNCPQGLKIANNDRLNEFVLANMDNLAKDIAMGKGETLDAFADLLQVPMEKRAEFNEKLQTNFSKIFPSEKVELAGVVDNAVSVSSN
ncbi:MAG TPA: DUF3015 domain-containing protein [Nitrospirota bacterium]|nr:DUF3015 domain-containing protein [Nitrospirota bacterium]